MFGKVSKKSVHQKNCVGKSLHMYIKILLTRSLNQIKRLYTVRRCITRKKGSKGRQMRRKKIRRKRRDWDERSRIRESRRGGGLKIVTKGRG
jgi:hypothetical protein